MRPLTFRRIAAFALLGSLAACGGSSTEPNNGGTLTVAEAQLVAANLFVEISRALSSAKVATSNAAAAQSVSMVPTTVRMNVDGVCTGGGTIKGTYLITSDFNNSGSGSQSANVTVTSVGCSVSTGQRSIAVGGTYTLTYNVSFTNFAASSNYVWKQTGNFTWSGGSCAMDYNMTVTPQGKTSYSGSFCGQTISYSN
jgi:hypothetical protein